MLAFLLQFDKFEEEIAGSKAFDLDLVHMAVKLSTGRMQFVFVNAFLQRLLVSVWYINIYRGNWIKHALVARLGGCSACFCYVT